MNSKATLGLTAGALAIGLLAGLALGGSDDEAAEPAGPGPTKTVQGVPVGYERTREGAVAAATRYSQLISGLTLAGANARDLAIELLSSDAGRDDIQAKARAAFDVIDKGLGLPDASQQVVLRSAAVGYKVVEFSQASATVEVWTVDVVGKDGAVPPQAGWGVSTLALTWELGDWKLASFPTQVPGPSPALQGAASPVEELPRVRELEEIPDGSVD